MKSLSLMTIIVALGASVGTGFASEDALFGRSEMAVEAALRDRGVVTAGLEEWGDYIRAWVVNGEGGVTMQLFDPDTLDLLPTARG